MGQLGRAVNFGFTGTDGIAATQFTGKIYLEGASDEDTADEVQIKDAAGELATRVFHNFGNKCTLEYMPVASSGTNTVAGAQTNTTKPTIGTVISITACASLPSLVKTNWIVVPGGKITCSNTGAAKVNLNLEANAGITVAIT